MSASDATLIQSAIRRPSFRHAPMNDGTTVTPRATGRRPVPTPERRPAWPVRPAFRGKLWLSMRPGPGQCSALAFVALAGGLAACAPDPPAGAASSAPPPGAAPRAVRVAHPDPAAPDPGYPSSLYVERDVTVTARRTGVIEAVLVDRGSRVAAGQPLA